MKRSKRGSMQLSIEAIIILVIAMVLLGLGIAFVTKMLNGGQDKLTDIIGGTEVPCTTNGQNLMSLSTKSLEMKSGEKDEIQVCFYSEDDHNTDPTKVKMAVECNNAAVPATSFQTSVGSKMKRGQNGQFTVLFTAPTATGTASVNAICTIRAMSGTTELASRDIAVVVSP